MTKEVQELLCTFSNLFYVYRCCKYYSNENPENKRSLRKFSFGWEGDFKMDQREREWEVVDWFFWPRIETVGVLWVQGKQTTLESRKRPGISWAAELWSKTCSTELIQKPPPGYRSLEIHPCFVCPWVTKRWQPLFCSLLFCSEVPAAASRPTEA